MPPQLFILRFFDSLKINSSNIPRFIVKGIKLVELIYSFKLTKASLSSSLLKLSYKNSYYYYPYGKRLIILLDNLILVFLRKILHFYLLKNLT